MSQKFRTFENPGGLLLCAGLLAFAFFVNRSVKAAGAATP
jgi:hypothetical protein